MKISGLIYFVTGGGSGLGLASVHALLARGAYVAVLDLSEETGERVVKDLSVGEGQGRVMFAKCDVRSEEDVQAAIKRVTEEWKGKLVGGVVHCGGIGMAGKVGRAFARHPSYAISADELCERADGRQRRYPLPS